jgi:N-acyl-D-amino-acid deacylase
MTAFEELDRGGARGDARADEHCFSGAAQTPAYDIVIRNGRLLDGLGNPWVYADVAILGGRIARIGKVSGHGRREIDARGDYVSPGWIDMMDQSGDVLRVNGRAENKLQQGITSAIAGEGGTPVPAEKIGEYFSELEHKGISLNFGTYYSSAQARVAVLGQGAGAPTARQLEEMKALVEQAMRSGAVGIATALIYPPDSFQSTHDLIELAKVAAKFDGIYASHMRDESADLLRGDRRVHRNRRAGRHPGRDLSLQGRVCAGLGQARAASRRAHRKRASSWREHRRGHVSLRSGRDGTRHHRAELGVRAGRPQGHRAPEEPESARADSSRKSPPVRCPAGRTSWPPRRLGSRGARERRERTYDKYRYRSLADIGRQLGRDPADVAWDIVLRAAPKRAMALFFSISTRM